MKQTALGIKTTNNKHDDIRSQPTYKNTLHDTLEGKSNNPLVLLIKTAVYI